MTFILGKPLKGLSKSVIDYQRWVCELTVAAVSRVDLRLPVTQRRLL